MHCLRSWVGIVGVLCCCGECGGERTLQSKDSDHRGSPDLMLHPVPLAAKRVDKKLAAQARQATKAKKAAESSSDDDEFHPPDPQHCTVQGPGFGVRAASVYACWH